MTSILAAMMLTLFAVQSQTQAVNPRAAALSEFSKRLQAYLQLRTDLGKKLEPMATTASASELEARQQALAAGIRSARAGAKQGDLIPIAVQDQIRKTVTADFHRRAPTAKKAALEEVPTGPMPGINKTYPQDAALPTVPPLLLASLPQLPDNLQYRFYGRHMVILDGDVEIVIDYVQNALPR